MQENPPSYREQRIRKITQLYYSRQDVQKAMLEFSKNREICPRYFEGFGKRPDSLQYIGDVFELVKKGATSFHCSEELWDDPLKIITGMNEKQSDELRTGWDLLIDIDCKWIDYSKKAAQAIIKTLNQNGVKNVGVKFSGSKGFHIIVPWKAFPKQIAGQETKNLFPELPRKIVSYIRYESEKQMKKSLPEDFYEQFKEAKIKKGIKCKKCSEIADKYNLIELYCDFCKQGEQKKINENVVQKKYLCPVCKRELEIRNPIEILECQKCGITSKENPDNFSQTMEIDLFELMGLDIILVSPRHLFRMPYSLHEKTALASIVLLPEEINDFELKDADHMKVKVRNFMPDAKEDEAKELVIQALDWHKETQLSQAPSQEKITGKYADYKPIQLKNLSDENFPPCVQKILKGLVDGKKRALFTLINLFRSVGMEKEELEKRIYDWNKKNNPVLKQGTIKAQLSWSYRKKPFMPPNCKEFYQGIGVCMPDNFCKMIKNPVNYVVRKNFLENRKVKKKDNFKK